MLRETFFLINGKNMKVIILCGGKGTRVSRYTKQVPKCLIDINGKPFLYHQLKFLRHV